jgi:hypothetical protein
MAAPSDVGGGNCINGVVQGRATRYMGGMKGNQTGHRIGGGRRTAKVQSRVGEPSDTPKSRQPRIVVVDRELLKSLPVITTELVKSGSGEILRQPAVARYIEQENGELSLQIIGPPTSREEFERLEKNAETIKKWLDSTSNAVIDDIKKLQDRSEFSAMTPIARSAFVGAINDPGYTPDTMGDAAHDLNALAAGLGYTYESAKETLERGAKQAARETTSRSATATPPAA